MRAFVDSTVRRERGASAAPRSPVALRQRVEVDHHGRRLADTSRTRETCRRVDRGVRARRDAERRDRERVGRVASTLGYAVVDEAVVDVGTAEAGSDLSVRAVRTRVDSPLAALLRADLRRIAAHELPARAVAV